MNKEELGKVPSLSCVENYFLGYFQKRLDVRLLYAESFVPFHDVLNAFLHGHASYENYPLARLQETSEKLGLTTHRYGEIFRYEYGKLNLIRVNREFFTGSKLLPWREDHFIAVEKAADEYAYWNNYPISAGNLSEKRLSEIYGGYCLIFQEEGGFDENKYRELCALQYAKTANQSAEEIRITEEKLIDLRDTLLILKVLRKRVAVWLRLEAERKSFAEDLSFLLQTEKLNNGYESLLTVLQLQMARKRVNVDILNEKLARLCESERLWGKAIQMRRE